jgi:hypothetical protein
MAASSSLTKALKEKMDGEDESEKRDAKRKSGNNSTCIVRSKDLVKELQMLLHLMKRMENRRCENPPIFPSLPVVSCVLFSFPFVLRLLFIPFLFLFVPRLFLLF